MKFEEFFVYIYMLKLKKSSENGSNFLSVEFIGFRLIWSCVYF